ncbi:MAG: glycerophosphodiester phosphodiesterase family protein [Acidiferrobacteraceae bacterium]
MEPEFVAHRGYRLQYPENTMLAIEAAGAAGARYLEVDVQLSLDEVPVLFHDDTLERVCGVSGRVGDLSYEHLKDLPAQEFDRFGYRYHHARIARLADLSAWLADRPGITAFVEIKENALDQFGITVVLERVLSVLSPCLGQCVLISFSLPFLEKARSRAATGGVITRWRERHHVLSRISPAYLFCDLQGLPVFGRLAVPGTHVVVYEVAEPALARRLFARGVSLVETFAVAEMRRALDLS